MPAFTGPRLEKYEELKVLRRFIGNAEYKKQVEKLAAAEKRAQEVAERRAAAVEARREAKRRDAAAAAAARREDKRRAAAAARLARRQLVRSAITEPVLARIPVPVGSAIDGPEVYEISQRIAALRPRPAEFRLNFLVDGVLLKEGTRQADLSDARVRRIHETLRSFYRWAYDSPSIFDVNPDLEEWPLSANLEIVVSSTTQPVRARRMRQAFRDGVKHCVAEPLALMWEQYAENSESDASRKRSHQIAAQIRAFGKKYDGGIPEGEPMNEIARIARRHILITDIFDNTYLQYNVKAQHCFKFFNARENHIDVGHICVAEKAEVVEQAEFDEIVSQHHQRYVENKEFYMFDGLEGSERCVRSARGAWRVANPLHDIYEEHNKQNNISNFGFNAIKYPAVNAFLKRSALINSVPVKLSDAVPTAHHDLKAAYTQHKMTARYEGIMGKVQQWRNVRNVDPAVVLSHLSICEFEVLANPHPLLQKLGLVAGLRCVLPSPEIKLFIDMGVSVKLLNAVFGSRTDIEYGEQIMEKKAYATWAGCLSHDKPKKEYNFKGSKEWANHLASIYGAENVRFNTKTSLTPKMNDNGEFVRDEKGNAKYETNQECNITVLVEKDMNFTKHHVLAFITSYTRINMIEALLKVKNPCYVVLDGIYHCDSNVELPPEFRAKPLGSHDYFSDGWYVENEMTVEFPDCDPLLLDGCVLAGQGGCGKTYSIMTDKGFNDILYVVPQHMLGRDINKKYGATYTTIHKLVGIDCLPYFFDRTPPAVCLIDELTMIEAEWIEKAIQHYPQTLFFIAGDVAQHNGKLLWFQCRNGKTGEFSRIWDGANFNWKYFTEDRRSRDDELKDTKLRLREFMKSSFVDGGYNDAQRVADWISKNFPVLDYDRAFELFADGDTWIAGTHRTNQKLLDNGVVSGYLSRQNEKSVVPVDGWTKRGSFTTHSFQGQTVESGRIFISINDAFEYAMIYTAVSRAVSSDQIVFVD